MSIEAGKLNLETKTGGFSKVGLVSKYTLRGDYIVQIDFRIDFNEAQSNMDQVLGFAAMEKSKIGETDRLIYIVLQKPASSPKSQIVAGRRARHQKSYRCFSRQIDNFSGSVRMVRIGDKVSTYYTRKNEDRWSKMCSLPSSQKDTFIGFTLSNFAPNRMSIEANRTIRAWIDNFKIIAAHDIIESEI